jgi:two-component system, cell cycle sensor histidine kinase and response regulator CckA
MNTILVVDDDDAVLSIVEDALKFMGYEVLAAGGGAQALQLEATHPGPIDLLLTDIVMPELSGPDLAKTFARRRPRAKLLYMSAFSLVDFAHHIISVDPHVPILAKPFALAALKQKVHEVLAPSSFARPPRSR